jgi:hypothetical protein
VSSLVSLWLREPARIVGLVTAVLALLVAFGVGVTEHQQEAVVGVVSALLILLGGEVTRSRVSPAT